MPSDKHRERSAKLKPQHSQLLLQLHLESNPDALCMVRAAIQRATELLHFHESDARAIVRSVDEALANVIRHAYKGRTGQPIQVTCRRLCSDEADVPCAIEVVLEDSGAQATAEMLKGRPLSEIRPGGLGLHFMRQSMDVVEFKRRNGKNILRMVKRLTAPRPAEQPEGA